MMKLVNSHDATIARPRCDLAHSGRSVVQNPGRANFRVAAFLL